MNRDQLRDLITRTLIAIGKYSPEAVSLLMGTAAQESNLGYYIRQIKGPAIGVFQMEPNTFYDLCNNYLNYKPELEALIKKECSVFVFEASMLEWNLKLSICFARLQYLRCPGKLPKSISGMAKYYKKYYNTHLGCATEEEFEENYHKFVLKT